MQADAATILERTKGAGGLRGKRRAAALALIAWRETRAMKRDRPRRWILADEALVQIASELPRTITDLERIRDVPPKLIASSGEALLAAIDGAAPTPEAPPVEPPDRSLVKQLQESVKERAAALGIQPELLATRRDIALAAAGQPCEAFTKGWRRALLGDLFQSFNGDRGS
jgi:ribonuclease D